MQRNSGTLKKKKVTSTPFKTPRQLNFSANNISTINNSNEKSNNSLKEVSQDDLDIGFNMYLFGYATTKMQESVLSQMTVRNEDTRLSLLNEIEKKRTYLASLLQRELEIKNLSKQTHQLKNQKRIFAESVDELTTKLKNLDMLKNSIHLGLPVKRFKSETDMCELKYALCKTKKNLDIIQPTEQDLCSNISEAVEKIENNLSNLAESQNRCDASTAELKYAVIEKTALSVLKHQSKLRE